MSRQCTVEHRPGLLGRIVSAQAAHPRGLLGRAMGWLWVSETAVANDRAIALLTPDPGEHVLEIGFGPGRTIRELAARGARVTGIEVSPVMLDQARRRNAAAIQGGQVQLHAGAADAIPLPAAAVDAVLAVHTLYFWPDLDAALREIHRVLAPAGRVVLVFRAAGHGLPRRFDPAVYRVPTIDRVQHALLAACFGDTAVEVDPRGVAHLTARAVTSGTSR
jgi:Methylase involved in ubiquinone/menaquinone biosynthesis